MSKKRADVLLYEKGLVQSREKGKRVIMEGSVFVGSERVNKPGDKFNDDIEIYIKKNPLIYVSRGGLKLEKAVKNFNINLQDTIAMDIGSSTGGFTDCMLQKGAKKVYAIDVGYGQLDWSLRNDKRVVVMERTNIRSVEKTDIKDEIDFISIDVSFISLKLVLPIAQSLLKSTGKIIALVKPQFETSREKVGKKGIIKNSKTHREVLESIIEFSHDSKFGVKGLSFSPVTGAKGNIEFLLYLTNNQSESIDKVEIYKIVEEAHSVLKDR